MTAFDSPHFELEKNRKAFLYTVIICVTLLLLFFIIRWKILPPPEPVIADLMEINLGNNFDGYGDEQPLIKGPRGQARPNIEKVQPQPVRNEEKVTPEDDPEGAPVNKPEKTIRKTTTVPITPPVPKPQKPKMQYPGITKGNGNNETTDNGYRNQGKTPGAPGDNGVPEGHPDSYGNTPGGKIGGPKVFGNRSIVNYYSFPGNLPKATIHIKARVEPDGRAHFLGFDNIRKSTDRGDAYKTAIIEYLSHMKFNKSTEESVVVLQFNFNIKE